MRGEGRRQSPQGHRGTDRATGGGSASRSGADGALAPPLRRGGGAVRAGGGARRLRGSAARGPLSCAAAAALAALELGWLVGRGEPEGPDCPGMQGEI